MPVAIINRNTPKEYKSSTNNYSNIEFVKLKPSTETPTISVTLRFIGQAIVYTEHTAYLGKVVIDEATGKSRKTYDQAKFPDSEKSKRFWRVCSKGEEDKYGACDWCNLGFKKGIKYAWKVLEKQPDGTVVYKLLNDSSALFDKIFDEQNKNADRNKNPEDGDDTVYAEDFGAEIAPWVTIKVEAVSQSESLNQKKFTVTPRIKPIKITPEEIEILRLVHEPNEQELETLYAETPSLKDLPSWYNYGTNLYTYYSYKGIIPEGDATPTTPPSDLTPSLHPSGEENAPLPTQGKPTTAVRPSAPRPSAPKTSTPVVPIEVPPVPVSTENFFSEEEEEVGVEVASDEIDWN